MVKTSLGRAGWEGVPSVRQDLSRLLWSPERAHVRLMICRRALWKPRTLVGFSWEAGMREGLLGGGAGGRVRQIQETAHPQIQPAQPHLRVMHWAGLPDTQFV